MLRSEATRCDGLAAGLRLIVGMIRRARHMWRDVLAERTRAPSAGATLVEVLVATAVLVSGVLSLAQLFLLSASTNASARHITMASTLAAQKVEQLRGLTWGYDLEGTPVSDVSTDTSVSPEAVVGGTGLRASPADTLERNTGGYVDHLDSYGRIVGNRSIPPTAVYTRRWSIQPFPDDADTLVIRVAVYRREHSERPSSAEAEMVNFRTRKRR